MSKTVIITGAGSGIGRAIANTLASQGYSLILLGRDLTRLEETRKSLNDNSIHQSFSCDIKKPAKNKKSFDRMRDK